jgi:glycosyltransferase involved in cell wall biosynthesis
VQEEENLETYRCSIIVPCFNEESRLRLDLFSRFLQEEQTIRFLFVNDGSADGTLRLLRQFALEHPERVSVLDKPVNAGKAEAVRDGMRQAMFADKPDYVGFWDADLATPLGAIPELLREFTANPAIEMVFGARVRLLGHRVNRNPLRHYLGRVFASAVSIMLRLPIYDTQCGAKIFLVTPGLSEVLSAPFHSRWIFDVEILARFEALRKGDVSYLENTVYEYPLPEWNDVRGSKVTSGAFLRATFELFGIWRRYLGRKF